MGTTQRDLALADHWADSLARSFARRGRDAGRARSMVLARDLTHDRWWEESSWRSQRRREARESQLAFGDGAVRKLAVPGALLAVGGLVSESLLPMVGGAQAAVVKRGDEGKSVKRLQRALGLTPDGVFGPATKRALKRFQRARGLTPDGVAGPATWSALRGRAAKARTAPAKGKSGSHVAKLQRLLGIPADGVYGPSTDRAVRRFQRRAGLTVDGVVGPATWRALQQGAGPSRSGGANRTAASKGSAVVRLQKLLGIPADGVFGPGTLAAVKRYQRSKGLTADGIVGPGTWSALGASGPVLKKRGSGGGSSTGSGAPAALSRAIAAANRIATKPYRYGGGHGSFNDTGYDCSGSISYVLHAAGKLSSPLDSTGFMSYGRPGPGRYITIYANAGHAFMVINGRRFDTSARSRTGSRWTNQQRPTGGYVVRHPAGM